MLQQHNSKNGRYYLFTSDEGETFKLPSVTTVTRLANDGNEFLKKWLQDPENVISSEHSMMFGRAVHSHVESFFNDNDYHNQETKNRKQLFEFWCESFKPPSDFDKHQSMGVFEESENFFRKVFLKECEALKPYLLASEKSFHSLSFMVAGTPDIIVKVYDAESLSYMLEVYDIKNANKRKANHHLSGYGMQLAVYCAMVKEFYNLPIRSASLLIGVISTGKLQKVTYEPLDLQYHLSNFAFWRDEYKKLKGF